MQLRAYEKEVKMPKGKTKDASTEDTSTKNAPTASTALPWLFGGLCLLFLMALVILSLFGLEIPPTSRFILVAFLALGIGLSFGFLGGTVTAKPVFRTFPIE
jgi:bacteriorhodopsin